MKKLQILFNKTVFKDEVRFSDFKKVFDHISVFEAKNITTNPGNSRYVFLGMYAFKGIPLSKFSM